MKKIKWAVLGAGGIARRRTIPEGIVPASNSQLGAVCSPHSGAEVAREFGVQSCRTQEELLATDCDAVYIATPVHQHRDQVLAAAAAGKHVLCEKPLGLSVDEAREMVEACDDAGVKFGVGLLMRFHASHREALRYIREGRIGRPVLGRAQLSCWYPPIEGAWRQNPATGGGGSLMDMGCHCIDLLEMLLGRVRSVTCQIGRLVHAYPSEDTATVMLEFESGAQGMVDTLFNVPDKSVKNRLELYGSRGSILSGGTIGQSGSGEMIYYPADDEAYDAQQTRTGQVAERIAPEPVNPYRAQIEAFSAAVLGKRDPPISGEDGLWNQRVLAACYESARTGRSIALDPA